ncbi:hypothetical protein ElyMa_002174400 [Elysia marginata]|uniref:Transmembrane protein n=1 Tax=Elysia marginata TaxID=1093978 RepID=A0AAV4FQC9_9GAST|nr:hypothetical protein ElyMa_002174400 [Elysia marginata]
MYNSSLHYINLYCNCNLFIVVVVVVVVVVIVVVVVVVVVVAVVVVTIKPPTRALTNPSYNRTKIVPFIFEGSAEVIPYQR